MRHPQELRRTSLISRLHWGVLRPESAEHPLSLENTCPGLGPSPFSGGDWGCSGTGPLLPTGHCPLWEQSDSSSPSRGRAGPALPLPAINTSAEASRGVWPLGSRDFLPPQSEPLRGLWLEKGAQPHAHPSCSPASPLLWQRGGEQPGTYWRLGVICFIFFNSILIIFFPALDGGGKWVNEYLIKVPSFHLGLSSLLSALGPGARAGQIRLLVLYPRHRPHSALVSDWRACPARSPG